MKPAFEIDDIFVEISRVTVTYADNTSLRVLIILPFVCASRTSHLQPKGGELSVNVRGSSTIRLSIQIFKELSNTDTLEPRDASLCFWGMGRTSDINHPG